MVSRYPKQAKSGKQRKRRISDSNQKKIIKRKKKKEKPHPPTPRKKKIFFFQKTNNEQNFHNIIKFLVLIFLVFINRNTKDSDQPYNHIYEKVMGVDG
jgi:hypothetical protein